MDVHFMERRKKKDGEGLVEERKRKIRMGRERKRGVQVGEEDIAF